MDQFVLRLYFYKGEDTHDRDIDQMIYDLRHSFIEHMDNDFNMPAVFASFFEFIRNINKLMDKKSLSSSKKEEILKILRRINSVLNIIDLNPPELADGEIIRLIEERERARKNKDWSTADQIREDLRLKGIEIIDTKEGPIWRRIG
jgi:cysteinyl-tRNA synthetase